MTTYIIRRLIMLIPVLLGVSLLTFSISKLTPGDPARLALGQHATPERIAELREQPGTSMIPILVQYRPICLQRPPGRLWRFVPRPEACHAQHPQPLPAHRRARRGRHLFGGLHRHPPGHAGRLAERHDLRPHHHGLFDQHCSPSPSSGWRSCCCISLACGSTGSA